MGPEPILNNSDPVEKRYIFHGCGFVSLLNADTDPAFNLNADPDPTFKINADPDPAFHQIDVKLRSLVYWPSRALFSACTPPLRATIALHGTILSLLSY